MAAIYIYHTRQGDIPIFIVDELDFKIFE